VECAFVLVERLFERDIFIPPRFDRECMFGFFAAEAVRETAMNTNKIASARFITISLPI
jgi:hypothetical protein